MLLAVLAALKAADYWLTRYELTNENRGFVQGATYTVVNAQLPALMLLILIALLTAGLFLSTIRTNRWRLPIVASGLWLVVLLVGGLIYPALVQSLVVKPNQADREAPYIERNVIATRQAMGLDDVDVEPISSARSPRRRWKATSSRSATCRLLNPVEMKSPLPRRRGSGRRPCHRRSRCRPLHARRSRRGGADRRPRARPPAGAPTRVGRDGTS